MNPAIPEKEAAGAPSESEHAMGTKPASESAGSGACVASAPAAGIFSTISAAEKCTDSACGQERPVGQAGTDEQLSDEPSEDRKIPALPPAAASSQSAERSRIEVTGGNVAREITGALPPRSNPDSAAGKAIRQDSGQSQSEEQTLHLGYHTFNSLEGVDLPEYVREHNATLSFPEKLMLMLIHIEKLYSTTGKKPEEAPIAWCLGGRAFVIRNRDMLVEHWLPLFFRQAKFSSFTRKLYRWGFRQVNMPQEHRDDQANRDLYFGNENFQRDNKALLAHMRSVTAAGLRRERAAEESAQAMQFGGMSRQGEESKMGGLPFGFPPQGVPFLNPNLSSVAGMQGGLVQGGLDHVLSQPNFGQHPLLQQGPAGNPLQRQLAILQAQVLQPRDAQTSQYLLNLSRQMQNQAGVPSLLAAAPHHLSQQPRSYPQSDAERDRLRALFDMFVRNTQGGAARSGSSSGGVKDPPPPNT